MSEFNKLIEVNIEDEMKKSYIDYAMSVIVARALPDVRDGLKPVHRRILYAMNDLKLTPEKSYSKSARIVGETMGNYHPHGDSSIYDALVRLAQDFSMRYTLVDGHGNFGSIDGDSPAASRYTESKLDKLATYLLKDIEKNTVDYTKTYDERLDEPVVLPARYPNLLVNGANGIAVGMATNIPPHNITEIINAVIKIIDNKVEEERETSIEEILTIVKGPDYPTSATILGTRGIKDAYMTGKGKVVVRSVCEIETLPNGKDQIIVTEIPYQVNKSRLVEKIAELVREKKVDGITDLRDESDRNGIRIVIELRKDVNSNVLLNQLYKYSQLQESYGINLLALVNNEPKVLTLLQMLDYYLEHQKDVVTRRTKFDLDKAEKRKHIIDGFFIALDNIDEVIKIIRASKDTAEAKTNLSERFALSEAQTTAIVEMRLRALTGLERDKLQKEHDELVELITKLLLILNDEKMLYKTIKEELEEVLQKHGDERRTKIVPYFEDLLDEDLIDNELSVITMTNLDYIKRIPLTTYKAQNRGGKGIMGMQTRDEDEVKSMIVCQTHDNILFFTSKGRVYKVKGYEIPEASRNAKGTSINNLLQLEPEETIKSIIPLSKELDVENKSFVFVTKKGIMKKTFVSEFKNIRTGGIIAINIREEDELVDVSVSSGNDSILVATKDGIAVKFDEMDIRNLSRNTAGVKAITLKELDEVVAFIVCNDNDKVLTISKNGYGKATFAQEFRTQKRGGKGSYAYKVTEKTGSVVTVLKINEGEEVMILNNKGIIIRIKTDEIRETGRIAQGVKLINLTEDEQVISASVISREQIEEEDNEILEHLATEDNETKEDTPNE